MLAIVEDQLLGLTDYILKVKYIFIVAHKKLIITSDFALRGFPYRFSSVLPSSKIVKNLSLTFIVKDNHFGSAVR